MHLGSTGATIEVGALRTIVAAWCRRAGFSAADAATVATVIVDADLHGAHSHGIRLLVSLAPDIERGTIDVSARPVLESEQGAATVLDGRHGFGPVVCMHALEHAIERSRRFGIAAVAVRDSSHWGRPAYYGRVAAERGVILIAVSNSAAAMVLWGAAEKSVGNNPIVIAVPRPDGEPIVLDISMQVAAWGRVRLLRDAGERLPAPWGFGRDGLPTVDPDELLASGRMRPMGDHKGSGLAVVFELLTAGLAGGLHSLELTKAMAAGGHQHKSQLFVALDPAMFAGAEALARVVASYAAAIREVPVDAGRERPRLPGEGSAAHRSRHLSQGIAMTPMLQAAIDRLTAA